MNWPDEIFTVAAEGGLFEKTRNKLVIFDDVDVLLFKGTVSSAFALCKSRVQIARSGWIILNWRGILLFFVFRHLWLSAADWPLILSPRKSLRCGPKWINHPPHRHRRRSPSCGQPAHRPRLRRYRRILHLFTARCVHTAIHAINTVNYFV